MSHLLPRKGVRCEQDDGHRGRCRSPGSRSKRRNYNRDYRQTAAGVLAEVRSNANRRGSQ